MKLSLTGKPQRFFFFSTQTWFRLFTLQTVSEFFPGNSLLVLCKGCAFHGSSNSVFHNTGEGGFQVFWCNILQPQAPLEDGAVFIITPKNKHWSQLCAVLRLYLCCCSTVVGWSQLRDNEADEPFLLRAASSHTKKTSWYSLCHFHYSLTAGGLLRERAVHQPVDERLISCTVGKRLAGKKELLACGAKAL